MVGWILILSPWVALLVLILHDATKEDSDGSAISIGAKYFKAFISWTMQKSVSKLPVKIATAVKAISSEPSGPSETPSEVEHAPAPPPNKTWWRKERRVSITTP